MTEDRYARYRQSGAYERYRTLFRGVAGLALGRSGAASWTLGETGKALARHADRCLPATSRVADEVFEAGTKWGHWMGREEAWWQRSGWAGWQAARSTALLPTDLSQAEPLPEDERDLLAPALFGTGSRRLMVIRALAAARRAGTHAELCDVLAASPPPVRGDLRRSRFPRKAEWEPLPRRPIPGTGAGCPSLIGPFVYCQREGARTRATTRLLRSSATRRSTPSAP